MSRLYLALIIVFPLVLAGGIGYSQTVGPCIGFERYPEPEPVSLIEIGPLVLQRVSGVALIRVGDKTLPPSQLHDACLSLFVAGSHKFIASTQLDKRGHFEFRSVPPGDYRLVARAPGLCTGNDPVRVSAPRTGRKSRTIVVYFQVLGYDTCTTAEYAK